MLTRVAMAVAMSRKREVRKKRSAGSAGALVTDAEAAIWERFIVALLRIAAESAARNDNDQSFVPVCGDFESAARAILRVRFETGSDENSSRWRFFAPRMRGNFATGMRKGRTVTLR